MVRLVCGRTFCNFLHGIIIENYQVMVKVQIRGDRLCHILNSLELNVTTYGGLYTFSNTNDFSTLLFHRSKTQAYIWISLGNTGYHGFALLT